MFKYLTFTAFIIFFFTSCFLEEPYFYEADKKEIVLNAILNPDSLIKISLTYSSKYPIDSFSYTVISDAEVKLYEDNDFLSFLYFDNNSSLYIMNYKPKSGSKYRLDIKTKNKKGITAETVIPNKFDGEYCYNNELESKFNDDSFINVSLFPLNEKEYYWINFQTNYFFNDIKNDTIYLKKNNLVRGLFSNDRIFDDFNATQDEGFLHYDSFLRIEGPNANIISFDVTSYVDGWFNFEEIQNLKKEEEFTMVVFKINKELDNYWKAVFLNYLNQSIEVPNPFYEPISIQTNVQGATGIFGAVNSFSLSISPLSCK